MKKKFFALACVIVIVVCMAVPAFAAGEGAAVTGEMLEPVLDGVKDNLAVIVPVAIGLFAIMLGIGLIPLLFKKFTRH